MALVTRVERPPHYGALLIGTKQYQSEKWNKIAAGITAEIELANEIFRRRLEYDTCDVSYATGNDSLRETVTNWAGSWPDQSALDVNVLYYTGHGHVSQSGQLRLITSDIQPGKEHSAVAATEIVSWLEPLKGSTLVVLDTCYSGAVAVDALVLLERQASNRLGGSRIQFLTSAQRIEEARPGWFMEGLGVALDRARTKYDEWLPMEKILAHVNDHLAKQSLDARLNAIRAQALKDEISEDVIARMLDEEKKKNECESANG